MDEQSTSGEPGGHLPTQGEHAGLQGAFELLTARRYERVERLLLERQMAAQRSGQMALVVILAAACQLCLTCKQFRADRELHQLGLEEATRRERESRLQIQAVLGMLSQLTTLEKQMGAKTVPGVPSTTPEISEPVEKKLKDLPSLFDKVKQLLGFEPPSSLDESEIATAESIDPNTPAAESKREAALSEEVDLLLDRENLLEAIDDDGESLLDHGPAGVPPSVQVRPATSPKLLHLRPDNISAYEDPGMPSLVVYCLGPFHVYQNDRLITSWSGLKGLSIFKYIIAHEGRPVAKEVLMDVFWPDTDFEATRRNLHQAIYSLRQTLRHRTPNFQHILFRNDHYELNPAIESWIDFVEFERHVKAGKRLEVVGNTAAAIAEYGIAEGLYQGDFLSEDLYEPWLLAQREKLRAIYLVTADRLSAYYQQREEHAAAIAICQKILAHDNCYETAHRRLMESYLAFGQRHLAIRQYEVCLNALAKELDVRPSEETVKLHNSIRLI